MKNLKILISCCVLIVGFNTTQAQIGKLKSLGKSALSKTENESKKTPEKQTPEIKDTKTEQDQPISQKRQKDADGYIIDDPEVKKLLDGKTVYYSSDIRLFASLLNYFNSFKMAGVAIMKTPDSLHLFIVAQKQYQGVVSSEIHYNKIGNYYFDSKYKTYAAIQDDQSILLFNHNGFSPLHSELISPNKSAVEKVTEVELNKKAEPILQEIKKEKDAQNAKANIQENETFFKSGGVSAVKKDPALETKFLKILNQENSYPTVAEKDRVSYKKILLIFTDWTIEKNDFDIPLKMVYAAWAIGSYTADKRCFFQKVYMKKDYLGGGTYGEVKYDESQKPSIGSCDIIK